MKVRFEDVKIGGKFRCSNNKFEKTDRNHGMLVPLGCSDCPAFFTNKCMVELIPDDDLVIDGDRLANPCPKCAAREKAEKLEALEDDLHDMQVKRQAVLEKLTELQGESALLKNRISNYTDQIAGLKA